MALLDLSLVTQTLVKLVEESVKASPAWPEGQNAAVGGLPPDRLEGDNAIGLYLYHLCEDAAYKNQVWPGRPQPPMRFSPMGLNLYYVLSAHSGLADSLGPYREQLLMGLAVKALHDRPVIDEATSINGVGILHPDLRDADNRLRLELRHVPPNEAVSYWTAGAHPLRLSSYYEVHVVLLEPDEPPGGSGRVLRYGIQTFLGGQPRLETSRNHVTFRLPGESSDRTIEVQPGSAPPGTEITFFGTNLAGDAVSLLVRARTWDDELPLDDSWGVAAGADRIFATARTRTAGRAVLPGPYTATAKVVRRLELPGGATREVEQLSNQTPFTIVPSITAMTAPVGGAFTVTGATFQDPELPPGAVRAYIGGTQLAPRGAGALAPGQFEITSATTIDMRLPADAVPGRPAPVRVVVNGAESPPRWIDVP